MKKNKTCNINMPGNDVFWCPSNWFTRGVWSVAHLPQCKCSNTSKVQKHFPYASALSNFGMSFTMGFFSNWSTKCLICTSDISHSIFIENARRTHECTITTNNSTLLSQNISCFWKKSHFSFLGSKSYSATFVDALNQNYGPTPVVGCHG